MPGSWMRSRGHISTVGGVVAVEPLVDVPRPGAAEQGPRLTRRALVEVGGGRAGDRDTRAAARQQVTRRAGPAGEVVEGRPRPRPAGSEAGLRHGQQPPHLVEQLRRLRWQDLAGRRGAAGPG